MNRDLLGVELERQFSERETFFCAPYFCSYCGFLTDSSNKSVAEQKTQIIDHLLSCDKNIFRIEMEGAIKERDDTLELCHKLSKLIEEYEQILEKYKFK